MNLQDVQNRIQVLLTQWVGEIKAETDFGQNDKKVISEIVLLGLLRETHGYKHLKTMNANAGFNYPGIDLADEQARVAIQVTATSSSAKILHTLEEFLKFEQYKSFDRLIMYILTEKQQSYLSKDLLAKLDELKQKQQAQGLEKEIFDLRRDVWDSSDLKHAIAAMQIEQAERVLEILERNFGPRSSRKARNVPYSTAPELNRYVPRELEYEEIKQALLNDHEPSAVGIQGTAALRGTGGFGKTTLAKAICADPEVKVAFPDGMYWLQLNEHATRDAALGKLNDFLRWLDPNQDPVGTIETARAAIKQALSQLRVLLVIDDAWTRGALEPFDGLGCSTLVTTRHLNVLPTGCQTVTVDAMQPVEAVETLLLDLERAPAEVQRLRQPLNTLAKRVGHWPVLLGLINAWIRNELATGLSLEESIHMIEALLEQGGITVLDDQTDIESRSKAVTFTVQTSLERLPNLPGTMGLARDRFVQLAIFPEDVTIPLEVLASLWGLQPLLAKQVCGVLWDAGLLLERTPQSVRLHDVFRKYLIDAHHTELPGWHTKLLAACRPKSKRWAALSKENTYLWRWLPNHLEGAGLIDELRTTAFDFEFLQTKLEVLQGDVNAVIDGVGRVSDRNANLLARTLRLGAHVLTRNPEQLAFQLVGRLIGHPLLDVSDGLRELVTTAEVRLKAQGLESVVQKPFLTPPGVQERVLEGHTGSVIALAVLDDHRIVSGSSDNTVRVWDLETGENTVLEGHTGNVNAVAMLDDHRIVSGADDRTVRVWDLNTGESRVLKGHNGSVSAVAMLDDHRIVSGAEDNTVRVWDLKTGESTVLEGHTDVVRTVVVLDDHRIVSGAEDRTVRVWDLETGESRVFKGHNGSVSAVAVLGDHRIVSGAEDRTVRVWDLKTGESRVLEGHTDVVHTVVVLDDHRIVSGSNDRTVRVWNIEMAKLEFKGPMPEITKVRVQQLWYRVVDRNNVLNGHRGSVNALAVLSDQRIVSGSNDKTVLVWDLKMRKQIVRSRRSSSVRDASLPLNVVSHSVIPLPRPRRLHNQPQFAYGRTDSNLWPLIARTHMSGVNAVKVFDDRLIVSGLSDGTMHVWDLETGKDIIQFQFDAPIEKLAFRKDVLAIQTNDDRAFVFRTHF